MPRQIHQDPNARQRIRALRRARRYIRANQGTLARVLNTYNRVVGLDPSRRVWVER
jgi:hypothetical protein